MLGKRLLMALQFPSMKGSQVLRLLKRVGYRVRSQRGSHCKLVADNRPPLVFAWHDNADVSPQALKNLLVKQVGLTDEEIAKLL